MYYVCIRKRRGFQMYIDLNELTYILAAAIGVATLFGFWCGKLHEYERLNGGARIRRR